MSSAIQLFAFEQQQGDLSNLRVQTDVQGSTWFVANDVCTLLGYKNPRDAIAKHCNPKGVAKRDTLTEGGEQELTFINESNVYRLLTKSRLPEAQRFEAWVFEEVLPMIRRTGSYGSAPLTANKRIDATKQVLTLMDKLRKETDPTLQACLYGLLSDNLTLMQQSVPSLASIQTSQALAAEHPLVAEFWRRVELLQYADHAVNHSLDGDLVAINIPEFDDLCKREKMRHVARAKWHKALRTCNRFMENKTVKSAISGGSVKCWVFSREVDTTDIAELPQGEVL